MLPRDSGRTNGEGILSADEPRDLARKSVSSSGLGIFRVLFEAVAGGAS